MTEPVVFVTPEHSLTQCMALLTDKRVRHMPLVEHGQVIGMLSIGDLRKEMLAHHERLIRKLETDRMLLQIPNPSSY